MTEIDLNQLAAKSQKGDKTAYKALLLAITPRIVRFLRKSFSRDEVIEDVLQDILISLHRGLHTYQPDRDFLNWMYAIAKFRAIDQLRSRYRLKEKEVLTDTLDDHERKVTEEPDFSNEVRDALNKLPLKYREAIQLTKIDELSVKEAADRLKISESALKTRCSRGYRMLRKKLEQVIDEGI